MDFDQSEEPILNENVITPTPIRTSRVSRLLERYDFLHDMQELHVHEETIHIDDPTTYKEALYNKDSLRWLEVMRTKMDSMYAKPSLDTYSSS